jgi:hypothetical protein
MIKISNSAALMMASDNQTRLRVAQHIKRLFESKAKRIFVVIPL